VRLLAAGKSLVGLQDMENRYRMRRRNLLPKFGSSRNPFIARTEALSLPLPASGAHPAPPNAPERSPAEVTAAALKKTTPLPVASPTDREPEKIFKRRLTIRLLARLSPWARKLNPFARRSNPRQIARTPAPGSTLPSVQGELSLDRIKVVRNDLNDADVEIVPAKPAVKPKPEPVARPGKTSELAPAGPR
jgi:hypothetical protein